MTLKELHRLIARAMATIPGIQDMPVTTREVVSGNRQVPTGSIVPDDGRGVAIEVDEGSHAPRYAFCVEGQLRLGTFADYARQWKATRYSGELISSVIRTWDEEFPVDVELGTNDGDDTQYALSADGQSVIVYIDGTEG